MPIINDTKHEGPETINLAVFGQTGGAILGTPNDSHMPVHVPVAE